ncbi:MAG: META domain-containing protein [Roseinatronobacter sp.]
MRLAFAFLSIISLLASPALSREGAVTLTWAEAVAEGAEALLLIRTEDGVNSVSLRSPVSDGSTTLAMDLPPLPRTAQTMQAGLIVDGSVVLQSAIAHIADRTAPDLRLALHPNLAIGFSDLWDCEDGQVVGVTRQGDTLDMLRAGVTTTLSGQPDEAALFVADDGSALRFDGNQAELALSGQPAILCRPTLFRPVLPVTATGPAREWRIELGLETAMIDLPGLEDETLSSAGLSLFAPRSGFIDIRATSLSLRLTQARCILSENGLIYPIAAELALLASDTTLAGCAGSPLDLLSGGSWYVTSIFGINLVTNRQDLTLQISDGQISGRGTCNRYVGRAQIDSGRLAFRELGTTRLACAANLRNLELRFLDALEAADGFDLSRDGMLILRAGHMPILTAIRR